MAKHLNLSIKIIETHQAIRWIMKQKDRELPLH